MSKDLNVKFYDELSEDYHLIFDSWEEAIKQQALILDEIIKRYANSDALTVLDCACGIGTQSIGLASIGYKVYGTDISAKAIDRAKVEADKHNVVISFKVADFRTIDKDVEGVFDVVIACDNALPHLLDRNEMLLTAKNIWAKMNVGGLFIGSIRDYDKILEDKPLSTQPTVKDIENRRSISFQVWDWIKDDIYTVNHFTIKNEEEKLDTYLRKTLYRAYKRDHLTAIFQEAQFDGITWLMPEQTGYYQPIIICKKV
ncbi:class I SAM-dependent methyltransferase [Sphingobacterium sp. LRF_L2]|uniref:class I SAM-dependent methyltransferase n=1 Tax=Sphingobacterium sp. LRF_L2 TaxID=3369421 RepID=UPI003F62650F